MKVIEIQLFGAFRKYVPAGKLVLQSPDHCTADQLKHLIQRSLQEQLLDYRESTLVFESALATDAEVLTEDSLVDDRTHLALLPPVCGG